VINAKNRRSHFNFSILASYSSTPGTHPWVYSYIKVPSNADQEHLKSTIDRVSQDLLSEKYKGIQRFNHSLMRIQDIHLKSDEEYEIEKNGSITGVYVFATIGFLMLLLAAINFINLTTAVATMRFKEIGIKKVLGCRRNHLFTQFLTETIVLSGITFILSIGIFELFHPIFLEITGWSSDLSLLSDPMALGSVFVVTIVMDLGYCINCDLNYLFWNYRRLSVITLKLHIIRNTQYLIISGHLIVFEFFINIEEYDGTHRYAK